MARTFVDDDFSYFDDVNTIQGQKTNKFMIGEKVGKFFEKTEDKSSPTKLLELYRLRLLDLRKAKEKLTYIRGVDAVNQTNQQISKIQSNLFELENKFISLFADKQGAKNVINSITSNPDLPISDNVVAELFLNQKRNPNVVTPVPVIIYSGGGRNDGIGNGTQKPTSEQGSEVVDKNIEPKKDNTILYLGIGIIAVLLLTRN